MRVFLVNDYPILLDAFERYLRDEPWIEVVGKCPASEQLIDQAASARPDVMVMDPGAQRRFLPDLIRALRARLPRLGIIVMQLEGGPVTGAMALAAGADAHVAKEHVTDDLLAAIRRCARLR